MDRKEKNRTSVKITLILMLFFVAYNVHLYAQYSIGAGGSVFSEFGSKSASWGFNAVVEVPRDNNTTFTASLSYGFPNEIRMRTNTKVAAKGIDPSITPFPIDVNLYRYESTNYLSAQFGQRYYTINGFDEGFSLYGGTLFGLTYSTIKWSLHPDTYDTSKYSISNDIMEQYRNKYSINILRFQIAFNGGMKYTIPNVGSFFFDAGMLLTLLPLVSDEEGSNPPTLRSVTFNANIGFRKELY